MLDGYDVTRPQSNVGIRVPLRVAITDLNDRRILLSCNRPNDIDLVGELIGHTPRKLNCVEQMQILTDRVVVAASQPNETADIHLRGRSEVVVKSVRPLLAAIGWIAGATILGDGRVVLVVDAPVLLQMAAARPAPLAPDADAGEERGPVVMVVPCANAAATKSTGNSSIMLGAMAGSTVMP